MLTPREHELLQAASDAAIAMKAFFLDGTPANGMTRGDAIADAAVRIRGPIAQPYDNIQIVLSKLGVPVTATVDTAALARELAPLLDNVIDEMTDAEVERIAKRSADVLAARLVS